MSLTLIASAQGDAASDALPAPDEHMQQLAWFIGEWDVHSRTLMNAETNEWLEEDLHTIHTYELGGNLVFEHFFGPLGGDPFEAWSLRKYNPNNERWEQRWVDTSPGGFADWIGSFDPETNTFTGYARRFLNDDLEIAGERAYREVFDNITENSFNWRFEQTEDGGATWTVTWTLDYVRAGTSE
ncbi:MAG: DUF1579 family protein [Anaerolineae bacterium]|nr:DUF1579 family protein [Anaerolineae bacterium]